MTPLIFTVISVQSTNAKNSESCIWPSLTFSTYNLQLLSICIHLSDRLSSHCMVPTINSQRFCHGTQSHYSSEYLSSVPVTCQDHKSSAQEPLHVIKWLPCLESVLLHLALSNNCLFCFLCYLSYLSSKLNHKLFTECSQAPANPGRKRYFHYLKKPKRNYIFIYN